MAEDIVKIRYDIQLAELQAEVKRTLDPLNKIDEAAKASTKSMSDGAKVASKGFGTLANATTDVAEASRAAGKASEGLSNIVKQQQKALVDLERELLKLEKQRRDTSKADIDAIAALNKQTAALKLSIRDQKLALRDLAIQKQSTAGATDALNKSQGNLVVGSGLANNSVVELGRTLSDAPYGIRGVANNIQQLGASLSQLYQQTGSAKLAFSTLLKSFAGPLGFLVLFQGAIALVDYLYGTMKKTEKAVEDFAGATSDSAVELQVLGKIYADANQPLEVRKQAFKDLQKELPILRGLEFDNARAIWVVNDAIRENIELSIKRSLAAKLTERLVEVDEKLLKLRKERDKIENSDAYKKDLARYRQQEKISSSLAQGQRSELAAMSLGRAAGDIEIKQKKEIAILEKERVSLLNDATKVTQEAIVAENALGLNKEKTKEITVTSTKATKEDKDAIEAKNKALKEAIALEAIIAKYLNIPDAESDEAERLEEQERIDKAYREEVEIGDEKQIAYLAKLKQDARDQEAKAKQKEREDELTADEKFNEQIVKNEQDTLAREARLIQQKAILYQGLAQSIGNNFSILMSDQENRQKEFLKAMLITAIDALQVQVRLWEAQIIGAAAAASAIDPTAIPRAVAKVALVEGLFAIAKGAVQQLHDGTEYVQGPRGRDKVPAMIEHGERVVPTFENSQLNGISNKELPKAVSFYQKAQNGGFSERMLSNLKLNAALNDSGIIGSTNKVKSEITLLRRDLRKQKSIRNGF